MSKFLQMSLFVLSLFLYSSFAFADDLNIKQYPESPKEGEEVKLTLSSDKYDLNIANITWTIDGAEADSGVGRKTLTFKTNRNGLSQIITATVIQDGYDSATVQTSVEANTNFILYEGVDSYVPSFYKGRRLPAKEGTARVAFFSFKDGEISGLNGGGGETYTWKINGEEKGEYGGINKIVNRIINKVTDDVLSIRISKQANDGSIKIAEQTVPLQRTETIIYKTDEGKLTRSPISQTEIGKNIYLQIEPFFFSATSKKDPNLVYEWKINDQKTVISTPWSVVFSGKEKDSVKINLNIINNKKITQESSSGFTFKVE